MSLPVDICDQPPLDSHIPSLESISHRRHSFHPPFVDIMDRFEVNLVPLFPEKQKELSIGI